jgi:hypothetical protein
MYSCGGALTTAGGLSGGWAGTQEAGCAFFGSGGGDSGTIDLLHARSMSWLPSLKTALVHEFTACAGWGRTVVCAGGQGHNKSDKAVPLATDVWTLSEGGGLVSHVSTHKLSRPRKKLSAAAVSRPFPSWHRSISTEIYLCHACSCQEILRTETAGQASGIIGFGMGYNDDEPKGHGYSAAYDLYNTSSASWSEGTLPSGVGRQYGTAVGCGGLLLFAGGQVGGGRSAVVDIFSAVGGRWLPPANL